MSYNSFQIKRGDTHPALTAQLSDVSGGPNLNGSSVTFRLRKIGDQDPTVEKAAVVVDPDDKIVSYEWEAGDTDEAGSYAAEFRVVDSDGHTQTYPGAEWISVEIYDNLES